MTIPIAQITVRTLSTLDRPENLQNVPVTTFAEMYDIRVTDGDSVLTNYAYNSFCIDSSIRLASSISRSFSAYSSNELATGVVTGIFPSYTGAKAGTELYFDSINWLLNQGYQGQDASVFFGSNYSGVITAREMQAAIWIMLNQNISTAIGVAGVDYNLSTAQAMAAAALANGDGFVASANQVQGIAIVDNFTGATFQPQFVITQAAQLGDFIWFDGNQNGLQDEGEVGIQGVTVKLLRDLNADGVIGVNEVVGTTESDVNGYYDFKGLVGGVTYQVLFDLQNSGPVTVTLEGETYTVDGSSFSLTPANQGTDTALDSNATEILGDDFIPRFLSNTVTLTAGEFNQTIDAGFFAQGVGAPPTASLGDFVWLDANSNGIQDSGEAGIAGATVTLWQNGEILTTTTTDATGYYEFIDVLAGADYQYQVSFDVRNTTNGRSLALTGANQGLNDALDSDALIVNGQAITQSFTLSNGEFNRTLDAGFYNSGAGLTAPGTGTPGFWSNLGRQFWDGITGNETKSGANFPHGELLGNTPGNGLLVGDFNRNGVTDNGEDTLLFTQSQARLLVSSNNHNNTNTTLLGGNKNALMMGRAVVAGWLNYLAGNSVDLANGSKDIADFLGNAVDWLQAYQAGSISGSTAWGGDPLGLGVTGSNLHTILDNYNNGSATFATGNFHRG